MWLNYKDNFQSTSSTNVKGTTHAVFRKLGPKFSVNFSRSLHGYIPTPVSPVFHHKHEKKRPDHTNNGPSDLDKLPCSLTGSIEIDPPN